MSLDSALNKIIKRTVDKTVAQTKNRVSAEIPNVISGLDIPDNGVVKGLITDVLFGDFNSVFRSGAIKRAPTLYDLRSSFDASADNSISLNDFGL